MRLPSHSLSPIANTDAFYGDYPLTFILLRFTNWLQVKVWQPNSISSAAHFSPGEFVELFGKLQTQGYRRTHAGKIKALTKFGRTLIPAAELDAVQKTAGAYDELKPKVVKTKNEIQPLALRLGNAWQSFFVARRQAIRPNPHSKTLSAVTKWLASPSARELRWRDFRGGRSSWGGGGGANETFCA